MGLFQKLFGTHSENELKRIYPIVDAIDRLEPQMQQLSDMELRDKIAYAKDLKIKKEDLLKQIEQMYKED